MCICVLRVSVCLCVCARVCMCDPSGGSRQAPREFFNPWTESDSFALKWESGRPSLWTVCFCSNEKPQLHLFPLSHTQVHACIQTHAYTHAESHRYLGIYSAAGHTVIFSKLLDCYALFKDLSCVCVCGCLTFEGTERAAGLGLLLKPCGCKFCIFPPHTTVLLPT